MKNNNVKTRDNLSVQRGLYAEAKHDQSSERKSHSWTEAIKVVKTRENSTHLCYANGIREGSA